MIDVGVPTVKRLVPQLAVLRETIAEQDARIKEVSQAHPEYPIFASLPSAGPVMTQRAASNNVCCSGPYRSWRRASSQPWALSGTPMLTPAKSNAMPAWHQSWKLAANNAGPPKQVILVLLWLSASTRFAPLRCGPQQNSLKLK